MLPCITQKNLPKVKAIVESFVGSGILVTQAKITCKKGFSWPTAQNQRPIYESLVKLKEKMESAKYTIKKVAQTFQELDFCEDPCNIIQYIKKECKTMTFLK